MAGQLVLRSYEDIRRRMMNRVVARTALDDLADTASYGQLIAAAAREDFDQHRQIARALDLTDLDKVWGPDLDAWAARLNPLVITRQAAQKATSAVVFSRTTPAASNIEIPSGQEVRVPASGAQEQLSFFTTAKGTILAGGTSSGSVNVIAAATGTTYNVAANSITAFGSKPSGVDAVTNPSTVTSGRDRELDDAFKSRIRLYVRSLARGTWTAVTWAALQAVLATGERVVYAETYQDRWTNTVVVYVDNGAGTIETSTLVAGETVLAAAVGGEVDLYLANKPVKTNAPYTVRVNGVAKTVGTHYSLDPAFGHIHLLPAAYPTGLTALDAVTADYTYYTGLIQAAQKWIDGDPLDRTNYPGYGPVGIIVAVQAPNVVQLIVTANITVNRGYSQATVAAAVKTALLAYVNGLGIGESVILNEMRERAMAVEGMYDVAFTAPTTNRTILATQLARLQSGNCTIT